MWICVTVHRLLSRKVFWHVYAKILDTQGKMPSPKAIWNTF